MPGCGMFCLIWILLCVSMGSATASQGLAEWYNEGNAHYRQGEYEAAIGAYEKIVGQGVENGDVYYNLGNAYFKNGQLGRAIWAYERALKLMPNDEDVMANLRFANAQKVDKEAVDEPNFLTRVLRGIYDFWGVNTLAVFCLVFVFGIGGTLVGWLFVPVKRGIWLVLVVLFGFGLLGSGSLLALKVHQRGEVAAVVLASEAIGRSGPGSDFLQVFILHEGTKVFVERAERGWLLVRLSNGVGGWVKRDVLGKI